MLRRSRNIKIHSANGPELTSATGVLRLRLFKELNPAWQPAGNFPGSWPKPWGLAERGPGGRRQGQGLMDF